MCVYICIQRNKPVNGISIFIYSIKHFISKPLVLPHLNILNSAINVLFMV